MNIHIILILTCLVIITQITYKTLSNKTTINYSQYYIFGLNAICVFSMIFYSVIGLDAFKNYAFVDFSLNYYLINLMYLCLKLTLAISVGMVVISLVVKITPSKKLLYDRLPDFQVNNNQSRKIIFLCIIWILIHIIYYNETLLLRDNYVIKDVAPLVRTFLFLPIIPLVFFLGACSPRYAIMKNIIYIIIIAIVLGIGTRRIILVPILYAFGLYIMEHRKFRIFYFYIPQAIILFGLAMLTRNSTEFGLHQVTNIIVSFSEIFNIGLPVENVVLYLVHNFTFGTLLTVHLIKTESMITSDFLVQSLNLLPSKFAIKENFISEGNAFPTVPKNSFYILVSSNIAFAAGIYFGMLLEISSLCINFVRRYQKKILMYILISLYLLSFLFFSQYGLRQTVRPLYYLIFIALMFKLQREITR